MIDHSYNKPKMPPVIIIKNPFKILFIVDAFKHSIFITLHSPSMSKFSIGIALEL